jgi:hypothetical protein
LSNLLLPDHWPDLSNDELGELILSLFIAVQADELGIPADNLPEGFRGQVIEHILGLEASSARLDPVEKALHMAARGDFERAGGRIREHLIRGAIELKYVPIGISKSQQAQDFGRRGAEANKALGSANRERVYVAAMKILAERKSPPSDRQMARDIAKDSRMEEETVRGHLKALRKDGKLG